MRVLVSGYYGFGNTGDEALLDALLTGLRSSGHRPTVLSSDPSATRRLHGVAASHRLRGAVPSLLRCQALVSGGGGLLQDATSSRSLSYYLSLIRAARLLGKRTVVYGQSIGPLTAAGKVAVARALRGLAVAVRDTASLQLLAELGLAASLTADPALLLKPGNDRRFERSGVGQGEPPVVLVPRGGQPGLTGELAAVGRHLLWRGRAVLLLGLHPSEDGGEVRRLEELLPGAVSFLAEDHHQALARVTGARLVVSVRLHGLILAAAADTPFIGLSYDPKVTAFLAESNGVGFEAPVQRERLLEAVDAPARLHPETRERLVRRASAGLEWLAAALRERP